MKKPYYFPRIDNLSILIGSILLAYSLSRFIWIPENTFSFNVLDFYLSITFDVRTLISIIAIGLTTFGTYWLLSHHPLATKHNILIHIFFPALTAWVIGFPIIQLPFSSIWVMSLIVGGVLLVVVLFGEYMTYYPDDKVQPFISLSLITISYAIFLTLMTILHNAGTRLVLLLPVAFIISYFISFRSLRLRNKNISAYLESTIVAVMCCQIVAALHYWPLSPLAFGLAVLGSIYVSNNFIANIIAGKKIRVIIIESAILLFLFWALAYIYR